MSTRAFERPARLPPPDAPAGQVALAPPPQLTEPSTNSWWQPLLPMAGSLGIMVIMMLNPRPIYMIAGGLFAAGAMAVGIGMFWNQRTGPVRKARRDRRRYLDYLDRRRVALREAADAQRRRATWSQPPPERLWTLARSERRLWERRPGDPDALEARVGVGRVPAALAPRLEVEDSPSAERDLPSVEAAEALVERWSALGGLPVTLGVREAGIVSVLGARQPALALVRAMLSQLAVAHAPQDLRLAVAADHHRVADWDWCKWLPHLTLADPADPATPGGAHLVVVVDREGPGPVREDLLLRARQGPVTVLALVERPREEPEHVDTRLRLEPGGQGERLSVEASGNGATSNGASRNGSPATIAGAGSAHGAATPGSGAPITDATPDELGERPAVALARSLAPLRVSGEAGSRSLDARIDLVDLLGGEDPATLDPAASWRPRAPRDRLRVPIGVDRSGLAVQLDLKESALGGMGPHGLIVGATGSGKSELLRTLVTALAVTHAPEELAFALVDFKGGATFAGLGSLPHTAGVITNLADDMALVDRVHDALSGEQLRRQELLKRAGNLASVREYQQRREAGAELEPLPSLLVIVDEFSELLASRPEFIDMFVAIGRLGRSLGMHLLLASQRLDEGRLRGLESHLSYRIGLRTFNAQESRTVLGVTDAYELPPIPGSGYLKVDTTVFERFKAAMVSAPYEPLAVGGGDARAVGRFALAPLVADAAAPELDPEATELADALAAERQREARTGERSVMEVIVDRLAGPSDGEDRVHQVWLPPLPRALTLDGVLPPLVETVERGLTVEGGGGAGSLAVALGVVDRPTEQRMEPMVLDLSAGAGNLAVAGAPQSGKSTLLRTLVTSLALTHTPEEARFHVIDFGGGALAALAGLPHVGTVAARRDRERARRIVSELRLVVERREALFNRHGLDSVESFRARRREGALPEEPYGDVFLVVDGWPLVRRELEELDAPVTELATLGLGYGVHVVLSANRWVDIRPNLKDGLGSRLELRLSDPAESEVDRQAAKTVPPDAPGRALVAGGHHGLVALPRVDSVPEPGSSREALAELAGRVARAWPGASVPAVRVLPASVAAEELPGPGEDREGGVPVGIGESDLEPVYLDLHGPDPHFCVFGDGESGKTTFLRHLIGALSARHAPHELALLLVDYRRTLLEAVPEEHVFGYAGGAPAAREEAARLAELLAERLPPADLDLRRLKDRSWWEGPEVVVVVDDYDLVVTQQGNPLAPLVEYLAQGRDVGFHIVIARRVGGALRGMMEPVLARVKELGTGGLLLSGDRSEGPILGAHRAQELPPGRGLLLRRRQPATLVQTPWIPD